MISIIVAALVAFLATSLFGHVIHYCIHQPWTGFVHRSHLHHHNVLYPPSDFTSIVYRDAGKFSTPKFFLIAAIPLILAPIVLCCLHIISWPIMLTVLVVEGIMGFLHDYLHDAFHIRAHWLYSVPVIRKMFRRWVGLHYLHHVGKMDRNFGIFSFLWDRIFGSFATRIVKGK